MAKAKAATIGFEAATLALNAALTMGISLLISGAISGISYLIHYEENLIEKSEEAADKIAELSENFKNNSKTVSDIAKKFAEIFPTLSRNYDGNGNAIVNLSGNVDTVVYITEYLNQVKIVLHLLISVYHILTILQCGTNRL